MSDLPIVRRIKRRLTTQEPDWHSQPPSASAFWKHLAELHERELHQSGPEVTKRRQALAYFTWQWGVLAALHDPQVRFLLSALPARKWLKAWRDVELADDAWAPVGWSLLKRRNYTFIVRLLWDYAVEHGDSRAIALPEPLEGAPLPVWWRGRLISQDLANTALELRTMAPALAARPSSFLEVGAGYGRTAYAILSLYPRASYTIIDIEPALSIARWYLEQLFDPARLTFLTPDQASALPTAAFDVALSISTLQEMLPASVAAYLQLFDRVTEGGFVYLKQWTTWRNGDDLVRMTIADYPYPSRWRRLHWAQASVQTRFTEGLWAIPAG